MIEGVMPEAAWLSDGETLTYLHSTISTHNQRIAVPETPMHLDALLADELLVGGLTPQLGDRHLRCLSITGFPAWPVPGMLDELNRLGFASRRSEERRVGKECVSTCSSWWSPYH